MLTHCLHLTLWQNIPITEIGPWFKGYRGRWSLTLQQFSWSRRRRWHFNVNAPCMSARSWAIDTNIPWHCDIISDTMPLPEAVAFIIHASYRSRAAFVVPFIGGRPGGLEMGWWTCFIDKLNIAVYLRKIGVVSTAMATIFKPLCLAFSPLQQSWKRFKTLKSKGLLYQAVWLINKDILRTRSPSNSTSWQANIAS